MILASHFHDEIVTRALLALALLAAGAVIGGISWWRARRRGHRIGLIVVALAVLTAGSWQVLEAGSASHNHVCHAHAGDCGAAHDSRVHTHRLGGWAAEPAGDR